MDNLARAGIFKLGDRTVQRMGYGAMQLAGPGVFGPPKDRDEAIKVLRAITPIVCVQNYYNVANRGDDAMIDALAKDGIAYVPFFPLGGFAPLQSSILSDVAQKVGATPLQVALAWLLRRSPNILLIPGTSSVAHLRENLAAANLVLPDDAMAALNGIGAKAH